MEILNNKLNNKMKHVKISLKCVYEHTKDEIKKITLENLTDSIKKAGDLVRILGIKSK